MEPTHARPMTAYAALCAAAAVVLAQGVSTTSTPVADGIAQAGPPAWLYARIVTLTAAEQVADRVRDLGTSMTTTSVVPALAAAQQRAASGASDDAREKAPRDAGTAQVGRPVRIEPATQGVGRSEPSGVHQRTSTLRKPDRKADRVTAREARKADRASAKDARKARRVARHR